jgi:hypothetical protein
VALLIVVLLQLNKNNYFNIAKARRERREKQRKRACVPEGVEEREGSEAKEDR